MLDPYLRFPLYHRLPLHYRLQMEEEVVTYDNIVNAKGFKVPGREGEWLWWDKWTRDFSRGRPGNPEFVALKLREFKGHPGYDSIRLENSERWGTESHGF